VLITIETKWSSITVKYDEPFNYICFLLPYVVKCKSQFRYCKHMHISFARNMRSGSEDKTVWLIRLFILSWQVSVSNTVTNVDIPQRKASDSYSEGLRSIPEA
jgi:hypothetical protein